MSKASAHRQFGHGLAEHARCFGSVGALVAPVVVAALMAKREEKALLVPVTLSKGRAAFVVSCAKVGLVAELCLLGWGLFHGQSCVFCVAFGKSCLSRRPFFFVGTFASWFKGVNIGGSTELYLAAPQCE